MKSIHFFIIVSALFAFLACNKSEDSVNSPDTNTGHGDEVVDADGNVYGQVAIGSQVWMSENLRTTSYENGDPIDHFQDENDWSLAETGAWVNYQNMEEVVTDYGLLYNWYAVDDYRNICPCGWHVPTDDDWQELVDYLGGDALAGGKMKSIGETLWFNPNTGATNTSGFTANPGGNRGLDGIFGGRGYASNWWSSTSSSNDNVWTRNLQWNSEEAFRAELNVRLGLSVRCLKN